MKKQKKLIVFENGIPSGQTCNVCAFLGGILPKNGWGNCRKTGSNVEKINGKYSKCPLCPVPEEATKKNVVKVS